MNTPKFERNDILEMLRKDGIWVTFTKADGTNRVMYCTLVQHMIPTEHRPKGESRVKENLDTIRVYAPAHSGWRSFRVDSVQSILS